MTSNSDTNSFGKHLRDIRVEKGGALTSLARTFHGQVNAYAKPMLQKELSNIFEQYALGQVGLID